MIDRNDLGNGSPQLASTQRQKLVAFLTERGMSRLSEIRTEGVTAATVSRLLKTGLITRLGRGLYQLSDASLELHHSLAEVAKRVPRGVICMVSALSLHGLTDQMPRQIWVAIGRKDWSPRIDYPPLRVVRYPAETRALDVEFHSIEGVTVPVFGVARTVVDVFRFRRSIGIDVALQAIREALRKRRVTPAEISAAAMLAGVWKALRPYLEAIIADG